MATFISVLRRRKSPASLTHPVDGKPAFQSKPGLLTHDQLPDWYRLESSRFILSGYRPESFSMRACFQSLLYLHNETFNIYSHLLPALSFILLQFWMTAAITQRYPEAKTLGDVIIFQCFLIPAALTLLLSSLYHTMTNHSMKVSHFCLKLDMTGILILTLGHFISGIYVGFFCEQTLQMLYWGMIVGLAALTTILVLHPRLQGPKYRTIRLISFVSTGLSGLCPLGHGLVVYGWDRMWIASGFPYYLLEGLFFLTGAAIYGFRFPESIWPGKVDLWGSSHNIWHVMVVLAMAVHLLGFWRAWEWNHGNAECRPWQMS